MTASRKQRSFTGVATAFLCLPSRTPFESRLTASTEKLFVRWTEGVDPKLQQLAALKSELEAFEEEVAGPGPVGSAVTPHGQESIPASTQTEPAAEASASSSAQREPAVEASASASSQTEHAGGNLP
ncbi:hypothetical protein R1sor_026907 [Riccia sorocarpa]|uniref:Uncharacterized protein n=1 Tax=Riccia sorocarpa TaxID=122646 RepID=A0ABD3GGW3_9MARC